MRVGLSVLITLVIVFVLGELYIARAQADDAVVIMPYCHEEDGSDVDGPCVWVDPDTGDRYYNYTGGTE